MFLSCVCTGIPELTCQAACVLPRLRVLLVCGQTRAIASVVLMLGSSRDASPGLRAPLLPPRCPWSQRDPLPAQPALPG